MNDNLVPGGNDLGAGNGPGGDALDRQTTRLLRLSPGLPKDFQVAVSGNIVRLLIIDQDANLTRSGTARYVFSWAPGVDGSTIAGIDAGYQRSAIVGDVPAPRKEDAAASIELADPTYQNQDGFFYVHAEDSLGNRSSEYIPSFLVLGGSLLDSAVPLDVQHFTASESGEMANGTIWSALSYSCQAPDSLGSFGGMQLFLRDYPNLGQLQEGPFQHYSGGGGGSMAGKQLFAMARRVGSTAITASTASTVIAGTGFLGVAQPGDLIEILGVRGTILSVSDTAIQLTVGWTGKSVTAFTDWTIIGKITVYAVAVSRGGTHRADVQNAPSQIMLFDGVLSAPIAPTLTALNRGNSNVITWQQVIGTQIKGYRIYRALGNGAAFTIATPVGYVEQHKDTASAGSSSLEWIDSNFTYYQREIGQFWTYYAITVNERDDASAPSAGVSIACQLESPAGNSPGNTMGHQRNLLWNAMLYSSTDRTIGIADTDQDTKMGGGVPPTGFHRWTYETTTATNPGFQNRTEIILPASGAGQFLAALQTMDSWDSSTGHIPKASIVNVQVLARTSGGTPDGQLQMAIWQLDGVGTRRGNAYARKRLSTDVIDESSSIYAWSPSDLLTDYQLYQCSFRLRTDIACNAIQLSISYSGGTTAANVNIAQPMVSIGDRLALWTAIPVDPNVTYGPPGVGTPPGKHEFPDKNGQGGHTLLIVP